MSYTSEVLADSPSGYWRLGESSGNPQDSSGNARHVTVVGGTPTYSVAGAISDGGTAVTFDGTTEYFSAPDVGLDLGDVWTLEAWVSRGATGASRAIMSKGTNAYYFGVLDTGYLTVNKANAAELVYSTITLATGWHHVVATKNGTTVKVYIDGVDRTGTVTNATCTDNANPLYIGAEAGSSSFNNGSICEVAVYPTALSAARVLVHYEAATEQPPVWTTPADTVSMTTTPELKFTSPDSAVAQHFYLQLDTAATFDTGNLRTYRSDTDQTNWAYYDGDSWEALPSTGLASGFAGNEIRYTVTSALSAATWYRRVRAGTLV